MHRAEEQLNREDRPGQRDPPGPRQQAQRETSIGDLIHQPTWDPGGREGGEPFVRGKPPDAPEAPWRLQPADGQESQPDPETIPRRRQDPTMGEKEIPRTPRFQPEGDQGQGDACPSARRAGPDPPGPAPGKGPTAPQRGARRGSTIR
jgi:hypothetical protein